MAVELDIFQDTTANTMFADSTMAAEETTVDNARYNEEGERLYYWVPPSELGDPSRSSQEAELYKDVGGYYTEAEIRAAWDAKQGMGYLKEQTDWDNYWGYLTERQDLIDDGTLKDGLSIRQAGRDARDAAIRDAGGLRAVGGAKAASAMFGDVNADAQQKAWEEFLSNPTQTALMEKYGIPTSFQNDDGDVFQWNGSSYTKTYKVAGPDWGLLVGAAMTGYILGPQIAGLAGVGGGVAGGAASGAVGSVITQGIATGNVDFGQVATAGVLGGIGSFFDDLQAATPGTYGGWVVNGEVVGTAGTWGIEKGQYLANLLNIPLDEALGIMEGVLTGTITGQDLEGIAISAVGGWGEAYTNQWVEDTLGDQGLDVDNLFKEGTTNISTESLQGLVSEGFDALVAGGMDKTDALTAIYGFFDQGGSLDFLLPMLPELGFEGNLDDIPNFCETFPKLCDIKIDVPDVDVDIDLPEICPDGFIDNGDGKGCVKIPEVDITIDEFGCTVDEEFNTELGKCVPKGDITVPEITCPDGQEYNTELGECIDIKVPEINCPDGQEYNTELGECVDIEVPKVGSLPDLCSQPRPEEYGFGQINWDKYCKIPEINCPDGQEYNTELGECVDIKVPETTCPEGFRNEDGECVKIDLPSVDIDLPSVGLPSGGAPTGMFKKTEPMGLSYEQQTPVAITAGQPQNAMTDLNDFISRQLQKRDRMLT